MGDLIINIENGTSLPFRSNTFHACFGGLLRYEHGGIFFGCFLCHSSKAHWTFFGIVSCGPNIYFGSKESAFVAAVSFSVAGSGAGAAAGAAAGAGAGAGAVVEAAVDLGIGRRAGGVVD